ncbi:MAG: serine/threonine-protein kinase [Caldimonas sp.]
MSAPEQEDDRTLIRPRSQRSAAAPLGHTLSIGTYLRDYEITGLIGEGGFGIVYLAWDHSLQRKVAIKEYMPASMASRVAGSSAIVVKSERHIDTFKAGLKSFVNEARLLARFDHASLVKVYRFWEENGTAYMAMPFYEGPTLKTALVELGHVPSEAELRTWLNPLLDALTVMHAAQCFHRDIAPDNILLTSTGPLLLDFGAARRVIGDMTHALTVVLKPGYAPIEQYGDVASMSQGAWTDLYALACVVYFAITGKTPTSSVERLMDDRLEPLAVTAAGRYGDGFLRAIDAALAVRPQDRPQTEAQFRALLDAGLPSVAPTPPSSAYGTLSHEAFAATEQRSYSTVPATLTPLLPTQLMARSPEPTTHAEPAATDQAVPPTELRTQISPRPEDAPWEALPEPGPAARTAPAPAAGKRQGAMLGLALLLVAVGLGMGAYFWIQPRGDAGGALPVAPAALPTVPASATAIPVAPVASTAASASAAVSTPVDEVKPAIVEPRREPPPRVRHDPPAQSRPAAPRYSGGGARCSDILQKASLEPLTSEEAAYLKRECR